MKLYGQVQSSGSKRHDVALKSTEHGTNPSVVVLPSKATTSFNKMTGMRDNEKKVIAIQERRKSSQLSVMAGRERDGAVRESSNYSKLQSGRTGSKNRKPQIATSATLLK